MLNINMYRKDQKKEFYTLKARKEGYPARSVYKLKEIDEKFHIIKNGDKVLDLGSAPGSWLLYVANKIGRQGKVFGVDTADLNIKPPKNTLTTPRENLEHEEGNIRFIKKSIFDLNEEDFRGFGSNFNAVISDMAPNTSGYVPKDASDSLELSRTAFEIAKRFLRKGGNFVCKIFDGEDADEFIKEVGESFAVLKRARPMAVVKRSKEFYIVAKGYKTPQDSHG